MTTKKLLRRLSVLGVFGLVLMMAPMPHLNFIEESVAATVALPPADPATPQEMAEVQAAADEPLDTERVQATADEVEEFSLMAVVFDTPPAEPIMVRVQDGAGAWDEWRELHAPAEEGPDNPTNYGTEPFWVGASQAYEVNLDTGDASDAKVVLVRNETRRAVAISEPVADASTPPPFGISTRASWGARAVGAMSYGSTIKKAIVHHTVSGNSYSAAQVPGILRGIQAYHIDGRGWDDIGYNFLVDKHGGLWEGRAGGIDRPVIGAHAAGFNTNTVGISVLGDYTSATPSAAAIESISRIAGWKLFLGNVEPSANGDFTSAGGPRYPAGTVVNIPNVVGHTDVGSTSCPGSIHNSLAQIRQRAQEWTNYTRAISAPVGSLDVVSNSGSSVTAGGWTTDLDSSASTPVRLSVAGVTATSLANLYRPDVQAAFPSYPANTGFNVTANGVRPGYQDACVIAVNQNQGTDRDFGCHLVKVADPAGTSPVGAITSLAIFPGGFSASGSASDPDAGSPGSVSIEVDGVNVGLAAVGGGSWSTRMNLAGGRRRICIVVPNQGAGHDTRADCRTVDIAGASPYGSLDTITRDGPYATLWGWAFDPEATGPTQVNVTLDGKHQWPTHASLPRADVAALFPYSDARKGFRFEMNLSKGSHTVCAVAMNTGLGSSQYLGCETLVVK